MATDNQARKILILLVLALARIKRKEVIKSPIVPIGSALAKAFHAYCGVHAWTEQGWLECDDSSAPVRNLSASGPRRRSSAISFASADRRMYGLLARLGPPRAIVPLSSS